MLLTVGTRPGAERMLDKSLLKEGAEGDLVWGRSDEKGDMEQVEGTARV